MLSVINVVGMPSCCSSHTVSRAPCRNGRVSSANTSICFPLSRAARITPSAVPYPAVASAPALQCVSTVFRSGTSGAPWLPIARLIAISSSRTSCASCTMRSRISSSGLPRSDVYSRFIRSIAQNRLTAVGRVAASVAQMTSTWPSTSASSAFNTPIATPIAAATPIAGAPRMIMSRIAVATSR